MQTLVLTAFISSIYHSYGQNCNISVDAGQDQILCSPGQANLNATITGNYFSLNWSPGAGLADSAAASTSATVSQTTAYTVTVRSLSPTNLLVNGDFSQGDTGFTSDYIYGTGGGVGLLSNEGQYAIAANAASTHNHFAGCTDHTGNGNMMVVNASGVTNNVWCQTIQVNSNTEYDFSAWVTSVTSQNPAKLQFSVNGELLGDLFQASPVTCNWQDFDAQWASGANTTAEICIVNVNQTPAGNDFALDDISFREICVSADTVTVTVADLNAALNIPASICQSEGPADLTQWLGPDATPGGSWTLDGNPVINFDPAAVSPGNHTLRYTLTLGNCTEFDESVIAVSAPPNAGTPAGPSPVFCAGEDQTTVLAGLLQGADPGGNWAEVSATPSVNGAFNPGAGTFRTLGQAPGTYLFEYRLSGGGVCHDASAGVSVVINPVPEANAGPDQTLDCTVSEVELGTQSQPAPGAQYSWSLAGSGPISGATGPTLITDEPGVYRLDVSDSSGSCAAFDEVVVDSRITVISGEASIKPLTCAGSNDGGIAVTSATGGDAPYLYAIGEDAFQTNPQFAGLGAGLYTVRIMDANGCETALEVNLPAPDALEIELAANQSNDPPMIAIGDSLELRILLNKPQDEITGVNWAPAPTGCQDCFSAYVSPKETTIYKVTAADLNGCTAEAQLTVVVNQQLHVFLPNAFSPNDDGHNDIFYIQSGAEIAKVQTFRVLDRWGNLVFQDLDFFPNDPVHGWNGEFNNRPQNPAVYVYVAQLETVSGEVVVETGEVVLVR